MRCLACDKVLNNFEATRKYAGTQKYVDLCGDCFQTVDDVILVETRADLHHDSDDVEDTEDGVYTSV